MIYRFGENELDDATLELRRAGRPVRVQPKVMQLLLQLVRHRPRVVSKAELMRRVWPDAIVTEASLARAVSLARRAIGDEEPAVAILNVARVGYRFAAEVAVDDDRRAHSAADRYVGREGLRARIEETLDHALAGHGRTILLIGEAGIGKSRTAALLLERARGAGARVVDPPLESGDGARRPWLGVLSTLQRIAPEAHAGLPSQTRADLAVLFPELESEARATVPSIDPGRRTLHARHADGVIQWLERAAADRPLVVLLEDLHAADPETLWLLEVTAPRILRASIAIVATSRAWEQDPGGRHTDAMARVMRAAGVERWPLGGLDADEIRSFVEHAAWAEPDPALLAVLEEQTSGNPLLLRESLRSLEARGLLRGARSRSEWRSLLPVGIRHLLEPLLFRLPVEGLEVLRLAAVLGVESRWSVVAECLKAESFAIGRASCESLGLLRSSFDGRRMRFTHALIREALLAELAPEGEARRRLHARISAALESAWEEGDEPDLEAAAVHACEGAPLVPPLEAARQAIAAGEAAMRRMGFERAIEWYRRALEVLRLGSGDGVALQVSALLGLATSVTRIDGLEGARADFSRAADLARRASFGDLFARAALGFAHRPSASGSADVEAVGLLEEALQQTDRIDPGLAARVRSRLAAELRYADPPRARTLWEAARAEAIALDAPAVLAAVLEDASFLHQSSEDPEAWLALNAEIVRAARDAGDLELELLGQKGRVTGRLELGDVNAVDREIDALERTVEALATPHARWLGSAYRAMRALLEGDLERAAQRIRESMSFAERVRSPDVSIELLGQLVYLRVELDRASEVVDAAREQVRRFPDMTAWRVALARILLDCDSVDEAKRAVAPLLRLGFDRIPRDRGRLFSWTLAAEVARGTGDGEMAIRLEPLLRPHAALSVVAGSGTLYYGPVAHHLGELAATLGRFDEALEWLAAARVAEERAGAGLWLARTQLAIARVRQARGAAGDAEAADRGIAAVARVASVRGWSAVSRAARSGS